MPLAAHTEPGPLAPAAEEAAHPPHPFVPGSTAQAESGRRAMAALLRTQRRPLLIGALLGLVGSLFGLAQPWAAKALVDSLGDGHPAAAPILALTAAVLGGAVFAALGQYISECAAESVVCTARKRLTGRLLRLRISEIEQREPGDLIARATSDTTVLRQVAAQFVPAAMTGTLVLLATLVLMAVLDAVLLAVTAAVIVFVGTVVAVAAPRVGRETRQAQEAVGRMGGRLERVLGAVRTVKAAGAEEHETAALHLAAEQARRTGTRAAGWQAASATASTVAVQLSFLVVLGVGGARVASGAIDVATLVAFLLYLFALAPRVTQLAEAAGQFQTGKAAAARIREIEHLATETPQTTPPATGGACAPTAFPAHTLTAAAGPPAASEAPSVAAAVTPDCTASGTEAVTAPRYSRQAATVVFERVRFSYRPDGPPAHREVSFTAPARAMTALVGPSGAGKTTVFSLLERFHSPATGRILLNGVELHHWPLPLLRATIAYVEQDAPVLAGTLRDNLTLGAAHVTEEDIQAVVQGTQLERVIARLPHGLDTPLGHRGSRLSGGERQRVAVARALLRRPMLLLLDEATSHLDAAGEAALRETIADTARHTTVMVVAHRLATVTTADRIVVMEEGEVRATGTHTQLLATDSLYRTLAATQLLTGSNCGPAVGKHSP